jgi:riboflavin synthase
MFTGIIQAIGQVKSKTMYDKGAVFTFSSSGLDFSTVAIGDSIAVNGVCLTVIEIEKECFTADVSQETLNCSIFGNLSIGDAINLEKALTRGKSKHCAFVIHSFAFNLANGLDNTCKHLLTLFLM